MSAERPPTCFVGFFGLNRSLHWTYDSIRRNILDELESFGCKPVLAAHFNCPEVVHSPHSGEIHVPLAMPDLDKLKLELCWLEPQSTDNLADLLPLVLQTPLPVEEDPDGIIRLNAMHQLHSLRRLGRLLDLLSPRSFDVFCLLRADLMYIDPMPVAEIFNLIMDKGVDLVTASWHKWRGFNDRFAFCSRRGAYAYLNRIDWVRQHCTDKQVFHSEGLLRYMVKRTGLKYSFTPMRAKRVRATGAIKEEDFAASWAGNWMMME